MGPFGPLWARPGLESLVRVHSLGALLDRSGPFGPSWAGPAQGLQKGSKRALFGPYLGPFWGPIYTYARLKGPKGLPKGVKKGSKIGAFLGTCFGPLFEGFWPRHTTPYGDSLPEALPEGLPKGPQKGVPFGPRPVDGPGVLRPFNGGLTKNHRRFFVKTDGASAKVLLWPVQMH